MADEHRYTPSIGVLHGFSRGEPVSAPRVIAADTKGRMKQILSEIPDGSFVKKLIANMEGGNKRSKSCARRMPSTPIE